MWESLHKLWAALTLEGPCVAGKSLVLPGVQVERYYYTISILKKKKNRKKEEVIKKLLCLRSYVVFCFFFGMEDMF